MMCNIMQPHTALPHKFCADTWANLIGFMSERKSRERQKIGGGRVEAVNKWTQANPCFCIKLKLGYNYVQPNQRCCRCRLVRINVRRMCWVNGMHDGNVHVVCFTTHTYAYIPGHGVCLCGCAFSTSPNGTRSCVCIHVHMRFYRVACTTLEFRERERESRNAQRKPSNMPQGMVLKCGAKDAILDNIIFGRPCAAYRRL